MTLLVWRTSPVGVHLVTYRRHGPRADGGAGQRGADTRTPTRACEGAVSLPCRWPSRRSSSRVKGLAVTRATHTSALPVGAERISPGDGERARPRGHPPGTSRARATRDWRRGESDNRSGHCTRCRSVQRRLRGAPSPALPAHEPHRRVGGSDRHSRDGGRRHHERRYRATGRDPHHDARWDPNIQDAPQARPSSSSTKTTTSSRTAKLPGSLVPRSSPARRTERRSRCGATAGLNPSCRRCAHMQKPFGKMQSEVMALFCSCSPPLTPSP